MNVNFLIVSWRGFSGNDGQPSEKNLYIDANSTIKWLEDKGVKKNQMVLYGESLGTGIAVEVASKSKCCYTTLHLNSNQNRSDSNMFSIIKIVQCNWTLFF